MCGFIPSHSWECKCGSSVALLANTLPCICLGGRKPKVSWHLKPLKASSNPLFSLLVLVIEWYSFDFHQSHNETLTCPNQSNLQKMIHKTDWTQPPSKWISNFRTSDNDRITTNGGMVNKEGGFEYGLQKYKWWTNDGVLLLYSNPLLSSFFTNSMALILFSPRSQWEINSPPLVEFSKMLS